MAKTGTGARRAALALMTAVTAEGRLLSDVLPETVADLLPADRARAGRLATEALRWAPRADRVLGRYLRLKPADRLLNALRLGVWEICADKAAPHGVTDSIVEILKADAAGPARLANAVLRKVAKADVDWDGLPVPALPKWLRKPLVTAWGKAAVVAIEAAHARRPPLDLTPAPDAPGDLAQRLGARVLPTGSLRLDETGQVSSLPGFAEGWWWVQDAAAAIPARILDPNPGDRVLDLCAAPGGKTLQLAAAGADVTAIDLSEDRMKLTRENLGRTGLSARTVVADARVWTAPGLYDAVLLDAPCSATGTIRRHPDLPFAKAGSDLSGLIALQAELIDRAIACLRPGGRLVYCTCSLLPEEGEAQFEASCARHPGLSVDRQALARPWIEDGWITPGGALRLRPDFWPGRGGMDGFFIAVLRKPAEAVS